MALSQVRICRPPPPLPSVLLPFSWQMRMKSQFSDFYFLSYGWLYSPKIYQPKKKVVQKWPNLQERCGLLWKLYFSSWFFFFVTFNFWKTVDFDFMDAKELLIRNRQFPSQIFANLIQMLTKPVRLRSSIQNHAGSRGIAPVGCVVGEAPYQFFFYKPNG